VPQARNDTGAPRAPPRCGPRMNGPTTGLVAWARGATPPSARSGTSLEPFSPSTPLVVGSGANSVQIHSVNIILNVKWHRAWRETKFLYWPNGLEISRITVARPFCNSRRLERRRILSRARALLGPTAGRNAISRRTSRRTWRRACLPVSDHPLRVRKDSRMARPGTGRHQARRRCGCLARLVHHANSNRDRSVRRPRYLRAPQLALGRPISATSRLPFGLFFAPSIWICWLMEAIFLAQF
jgi:hypothetical protein